MLNDIKKTIEEIYVNGNTEVFISKCKKKLYFLDDLLEILKTKVISIEIFADMNDPSTEIRIVVNKCSLLGGEIEYISLLQISKVVDYFYLQDEFSFDNPDPDGMDSCLDGFRNEAYSKKQFAIDEIICSYLEANGYKRLYLHDMEEIFPGIRKFKDRDEINQMTVSNALFMDMWELCVQEGDS